MMIPQRVHQLTRAIRRVHLTIFHLLITIIIVNKFVVSEQASNIPNWDEQRAEWLNENPNFPNFISPNKPRVLLITESPPKPSDNPARDHLLLKSIKNKIDYCRIHGIEIFYNMAILDEENPIPVTAENRKNLPLIRNLLLSHPEIEFFWWLDSTAIFTDMKLEIPWERYRDYKLIIHGRGKTVHNAGSFLLRNCQWGLDLLDDWATKGKMTIMPKRSESMVHVEEIIEEDGHGIGDDRWAFVTEFFGCKIGGEGEERCLNEMDRAFNYGDNQVLDVYGFSHESLGSDVVKRVRNERSDPLKVNDELGFLHHTVKSC